MMENEENNNLIINKNGEAIFEADDGIIKKDSITIEQKIVIKSIISNSVIEIKDYAFCGNQILENANFPNATTIGDNSFYSCENLKTIDLSEATTIGGEDAFQLCTNLETIYIPNINTIGNGVFNGCKKLTKIHTSPKEQCKQIYFNLDEDLKKKLKVIIQMINLHYIMEKKYLMH